MCYDKANGCAKTAATAAETGRSTVVSWYPDALRWEGGCVCVLKKGSTNTIQVSTYTRYIQVSIHARFSRDFLVIAPLLNRDVCVRACLGFGCCFCCFCKPLSFCLFHADYPLDVLVNALIAPKGTRFFFQTAREEEVPVSVQRTQEQNFNMVKS